MFLTIFVVTNDDNFILGPGLLELSYFLVVFPSTFVNLSSLLKLVSSLSVFLVIFEATFIGVSIAVNHFSLTFQLIVDKVTINDFVESLDVEFSLSLSLSFDELANIDISITILECAVTPEVVFSELTCIFFIIQCIDTLSMFLSVDIFSFIDTAVGFMSDTMSMFFAISELSLILNVFIQITEMPFAIELVVLKLTLILHNSSQCILSIAVFFSFLVQIALVVGAVTFVNSTMTHFVFSKFTSEFLTIIENELGVSSHLDTISHLTLIDGTI